MGPFLAQVITGLVMVSLDLFNGVLVFLSFLPQRSGEPESSKVLKGPG